jgi:hypothetical protein
MMKSLKEDLEKDLKKREECRVPSNDTSNRLNDQIRIQIEHLEDQMKSVVFLLMRYQEGLDYCQELQINDELVKDE